MERVQPNTKIAGIDVSKKELVTAVHGLEDIVKTPNDVAGFKTLIGWLKAKGVFRVGLEATGGYERGVRAALGEVGLEVVVHQPLEVKLFARVKRLKAKNDEKDARLIAAATVQVDTVRALQDPRLLDLANRLTAYEQVSDQLAQLRAFMEHAGPKDVVVLLRRHIVSLERLKAKLADGVVERIHAHPDLNDRYRLLLTLPGIGPIVASTLVVRMPELGDMTPAQAASLLGVAPFDRDSGTFKGQRRIAGGRDRPRRMVYLAALNAKRRNPHFKAFAERLKAKGKPPKVIVIAVARKLIEAANLVLSRGQPWVTQMTATT
ncbi:transposase [Caulobacter ginsengisoli]|uniref:Transposase n=1 Tax=Caulobacter ginsengisoli TaxID=400775 RepID=A0ABU0IYC0_9CAUL|nr:IS110 family transposase [Caulobacter ginsengisoli]MDQ0467004.1 transposase [Caulobacter ginsengisoli]